MKKTMIMTLMVLTSLTAMAQRPSDGDRQQQRAEMIEKQADRLAKDFDLKGDAKKSFVDQFKAYQQELQEAQGRRNGDRNGQGNGQDQKKKLTDEEAKQQVEKYFARQEQQIANLQKRLEVERKYYAEFQKSLTPQQLARIFRQQRQMQQRPGGQGRPGGFDRPQGGQHQGNFGGFGGPGGGDF